MNTACDCCKKHASDIIIFAQETIPIAARMGLDVNWLKELANWARKIESITSIEKIKSGQYDNLYLEESGTASRYRKQVDAMISNLRKELEKMRRETASPKANPGNPVPPRGKEPWQMTREEFIANTPKGYAYDPNLREGLLGHRYKKGVTTVGDAFFKQDERGRMLLLKHEEGHDLMTNFNRDWKDVLEPFRKNKDKPLDATSRYENPLGGLSDKPEEVVADSYTALWSGVAKGWESPKYRNLIKRTIEVAQREGKPVPAEVLKDYPDLAKSSQAPTPEPAPDCPRCEKIKRLKSALKKGTEV